MSRLLAGRRVTSLPPTTTRPPSASSRPASSRSAVVLPQPDGPSSATSSPGAQRQVEPVERGDRCRTAAQVLEPDLDALAPVPGGRGRSTSLLTGSLLFVRRATSTTRGRRTTGRRAGRTRTAARPATTAIEHGGVGRGRGSISATWRFSKLSRFAIVNSPSTSATERSVGVEDAATDVRHDDPEHHRRPARPEAARRLGQRPDVDGGEPGVERPVGVRQHQDHVGERERQRRVAEDVRHPRRRPARARRRGRWPGSSAAAGRGTRSCGCSRCTPQPYPDHRRHQQAASRPTDVITASSSEVTIARR